MYQMLQIIYDQKDASEQRGAWAWFGCITNRMGGVWLHHQAPQSSGGGVYLELMWVP